ncbi:hypothetical protein CF160_08010 [Enterococcus pseudoavium]|nr:hypothetical protein CF160_08010 [Enterococcus pseudoavium]
MAFICYLSHLSMHFSSKRLWFDNMLMIFVGISNVIINSGFQMWLMQEKKLTNIEFSTGLSTKL